MIYWFCNFHYWLEAAQVKNRCRRWKFARHLSIDKLLTILENKHSWKLHLNSWWICTCFHHVTRSKAVFSLNSLPTISPSRAEKVSIESLRLNLIKTNAFLAKEPIEKGVDLLRIPYLLLRTLILVQVGWFSNTHTKKKSANWIGLS